MAKELLKGNVAIAEAALRGGCDFFAGYPITPSTEALEYLSTRMEDLGMGTRFVQAENEIAAMNMVMGAASAGARCLTASSGPGISLKAEGISYLSGAMLPAVIVNVSRGGPGLGSIQPAQQDYLQSTKALGHGGFRTIVLAPHTVQEAVDLVYNAFELAERDRNPVFILMDGCLGAVMEEVELPPMKELPPRPDWALGNPTGEARAPRLISSIADEDVVELLNKRAAMLQQGWAAKDAQYESYRLEDAEYVCVAYGTSARICKYAVNELRKEGLKLGLIRPITLYPFPKKVLHDLDYSRVKAIIDVEMAIPCQMLDDIAQQVMERAPILQFGHSGGITLKNEETTAAIKALIGGLSK